jgi:RIO kinase 1
LSSTPEHLSPAPDSLDPRFVFDFQAYDEPDGIDQRWSTWLDVEPLCRGPEPRPDWVVTQQAAIDTELGVLKTGKEADVFLLQRAVDGGPSVVMAAKRYRSADHRTFHRNAAYTEGRRGRDSREARAAAKSTAFGRAVAAAQWASAEWESLKLCWQLDLPVPYPVQIDGTELLMEWVQVNGDTARGWPSSDPRPTCSRRSSTSSVRRWRRWPSTASCTATCRRTTCWRLGTGS